VQVLRASLEDRKIDFRLVAPRKEGFVPPRSERRYDYAAAGERYSLPKSKRGTERPDTRDNAAPAVSLPPLPPVENAHASRDGGNAPARKGAFGKAKAAAKGVFAKAKAAAQGKKGAGASKPAPHAPKAGKKKSKR